MFKHAKEELRKGNQVSVRPVGNSMRPRIKSRQLVTIAPITKPLKKGDIVLVTVSGRDYVHLIKAISADKYQIANNRNRVNGWVRINKIHGVVVKVE